jgi:Domain of unknown function (DUF1707)
MDDRFRISGADRDRAAALLRDHFAAGRLTPEELDERLTAALHARTAGDLRRVLADMPEPAPVPQQADALERRYQRLLVCYPARYRRVHEEEMLAVLMTAAPQGKRRPGIGEAANLILGALRVRLQPSRDGAEPAWRDALAVLSVILPVVILLISMPDTRTLLSFQVPGPFGSGSALPVLREVAAPLALMALVLLRLRRVAALSAAAMLIWLAFFSGSGTLVNGTADAPGFLALGLEIVALTASPGPRRGLHILTWKHGALVVVATLAVSSTSYTVTLIAIAVICAGMALASSLGRWLLVLLAIPAYPFVLGGPFSLLGGAFFVSGFSTPLAYLPSGLGFIAWTYLPSLVLLVLAVIAGRRESLRSAYFPRSSR